MSESFERQSTGVLAEIVLEGHLRLTGGIQTAGVPRRIVDILNGVEGPFVMLQDGELHDLAAEGSQPRRLGVAQIPIEAILFAMPRGGTPQQGNAFETVAKVPVSATVLLPEYEISGNVFLLPGAERRDGPIVATRRFAPVTEAAIKATDGICRSWTEEVVVVNLMRGLLYLPPGTSSLSVTPD